MADREISELTAADTLDGDELVHVSQGGNSRKAALSDVVALSTGAMLKSEYDPNADGIIAVAQGGTNAATASGARTNLGLGTIAVQAASSVAITGGSVTGITDITVADGGTGASTASDARTNLGLVIGTDVQAYSANLAGFAATTVANVQNRVNHTGTILAAVVSDFSTASDLRIAAAVDVTVQAYSATLDDWSAIDTADKLDASVIPAAEDGKILSWTGTSLVNKTAGDLGTFVVGEDVQAYSANLDDWSALATSAKQDASDNLTTLSDTTVAATVTALKALDTDDSSKVALTEEGKTGDWNLLTGDYSAHVTGDPGGAWWLKADDSLSSAKAWRRARDFSEGAPIEFFGATGDATDDTQAFEDALLWIADDNGKNLGSKILLGPQTYRIGETQRVRAPVTIEGQGGAFMNQFSSSNLITNGTVLKLESDVNDDMFECWLDDTLFSLFQDYRGFMNFRSLLLHGNRSANANPGNTDLNNAGSGIVAKGTRYVTLDDVTVMMFAHDGINAVSHDYGAGAATSNNVEIRNSRFFNNNRRGIDMIVGDGTIVSNSIGYNGTDGLRTGGIAVVAHNWVWNNGGNGVVLSSNADMIVASNKSYDNQKSGFIISSDVPGGLIVGNMALRNNAALTPWTNPIDTSGFYIGTDSGNISIVGNVAHNLYSSNVKQQLYGFYFNDTSCVAQFDGNNALGNLTTNTRLASPTNIKYHSDTSTSLGSHPGFTAAGIINMNNNGLRNIQNITGNAWVAKTISSNTLAAGNDRYCAVTPSGAVTLNTITTAATGIMEVFVRNADATNAITVTHSVSGIRCPNGVDATISPYEMRHLVLISGSVWQMLGA